MIRWILTFSCLMLPWLANLSRAETPATQPVVSIKLENAWSREPAGAMKVAGMFVDIVNSGSDDRLLKVECKLAKAVEIHEMAMDGDVMRMRPVKSLAIPANKTTSLKPGSYHVMLINMEKPEGKTFEAKMIFEHAGEISVQVDLKQQ